MGVVIVGDTGDGDMALGTWKICGICTATSHLICTTGHPHLHATPIHMPVHMPVRSASTSIPVRFWLLMDNFVPLAGKFKLATDVFAC